MTSALKAIAFDMIETVFSLETLRPRFVAAGLPADDLEAWFTRGLRDAFALTATASYVPFPKVLESALCETMLRRGVPSDEKVKLILDGMAELDPHADAKSAFELARQAGLDVVALTNGGADSTGKLLRRGGLKSFVSIEISVEDVKRFKPSREVYDHAAARLGLRPDELALIAAHPWDVHGAKSAGLITGYVQRAAPVPAFMLTPDVTAGTLFDVTVALLNR